jgi:hypothetical protein
MRFRREKHPLDQGRVRFSLPNRKVPATYFPLLRSEPTKTPRKTASRVRQVESTFLSKRTKQWKVQTAQKTRRNSSVGRGRLESVPYNHRDPVNRFCTTYCPNYILSFTLHYSKFAIYLISTTCGDLQQKKCARGVGSTRKSTESTFGSHFQTSRFSRESFKTLSVRSHFTLWSKKVFSHLHNDFEQAHLTPMITSQNSPENQTMQHLSPVPLFPVPLAPT